MSRLSGRTAGLASSETEMPRVLCTMHCLQVRTTYDTRLQHVIHPCITVHASIILAGVELEGTSSAEEARRVTDDFVNRTSTIHAMQ